MKEKRKIPQMGTMIPEYEISYLGYLFGGGRSSTGFHFIMIMFPDGVDIESTYLKKKDIPKMDTTNPATATMLVKLQTDPNLFLYCLDGNICASEKTRFTNIIDDNFNTNQTYIFKSKTSNRQILAIPQIGSGGSDKTTLTLIREEDFEYAAKTYENIYSTDPMQKAALDGIRSRMNLIEKWEKENDYDSIRKEFPTITDIVYVTKESAIEMTKEFIEDITHMNDTKTKHSNLLNKLQASKQNITKSTNGGKNK